MGGYGSTAVGELGEVFGRGVVRVSHARCLIGRRGSWDINLVKYNPDWSLTLYYRLLNVGPAYYRGEFYMDVGRDVLALCESLG